MKHTTVSFIYILLFIIGSGLLAVNFYGLSQSIRSEGLETSPSRFENDFSLSYEESLMAIKKRDNETEKEFLKRLTFVISQSLLHIHWDKEKDTSKFNQHIPIWENYFLYFMGVFTDIPEYKKYHYADYKRSLKRGIGICGDASMVMSGILDENNIENKILAYKGHVVVKAISSDGEEQVYDPDFGVTIGVSPQELKNNKTLVLDEYQSLGYSKEEAMALYRSYSLGHSEWDNVKHFITKKYYFEQFAYALKWPFPLLLIVIGIWLKRKNRV